MPRPNPNATVIGWTILFVCCFFFRLNCTFRRRCAIEKEIEIKQNIWQNRQKYQNRTVQGCWLVVEDQLNLSTAILVQQNQKQKIHDRNNLKSIATMITKCLFLFSSSHIDFFFSCCANAHLFVLWMKIVIIVTDVQWQRSKCEQKKIRPQNWSIWKW